MKNRAFTLIELLVVVLIIGILAAIAVPQYQKAVDKTRYTTVFNMVKAIKDAQEVYYLANGRYATNFNDLDVTFPKGDLESASASYLTYKNGDIYYMFIPSNLPQSIKGVPGGFSNQLAFEWYFEHHLHDPDGAPDTSYVLCTGADERSKKVCKSLGGTKAFEGYEQYFYLPF